MVKKLKYKVYILGTLGAPKPMTFDVECNDMKINGESIIFINNELFPDKIVFQCPQNCSVVILQKDE